MSKCYLGSKIILTAIKKLAFDGNTYVRKPTTQNLHYPKFIFRSTSLDQIIPSRHIKVYVSWEPS